MIEIRIFFFLLKKFDLLPFLAFFAIQELQNKIAGMLRTVPKNDKEGRKKLQAEIAQLEAELKHRHSEELQQWERQHQTQQTVCFFSAVSYLQFFSILLIV
jgi:hypothetical protein